MNSPARPTAPAGTRVRGDARRGTSNVQSGLTRYPNPGANPVKATVHVHARVAAREIGGADAEGLGEVREVVAVVDDAARRSPGPSRRRPADRRLSPLPRRARRRGSTGADPRGPAPCGRPERDRSHRRDGSPPTGRAARARRRASDTSTSSARSPNGRTVVMTGPTPRAGRRRSPRRHHVDARLTQRGPHRAGHVDGAGRVAVHAQRHGIHPHERADRSPRRRRPARGAPRGRRRPPGRGARRRVRRGARAIRRRGTRGRGTPRGEREPGVARGIRDLTGESQHRQRPSEPCGDVGDGRGDGIGLRPVVTDRVVERAVRFDVTQVGAGVRERAELNGDARPQVGGRQRHRRAPEPRAVGIGRMRTDRDARGRRARDGLAHRRGVTRVAAACHVRARDQSEQRLIVGGRHAVDRLAEVRVEVDHRHADHGTAPPPP